MHRHKIVRTVKELRKAITNHAKDGVVLDAPVTVHVRSGGRIEVATYLGGGTRDGYEVCDGCGWTFETDGGHRCAMPTGGRRNMADVLRELLTEDEIKKLVEYRGGAVIAVPLNPCEGQVLSGVIGLRAVEALASRYKGCRVYVPMSSSIERSHRNVEMRDAYDAGMSIADMRRRFNMSHRHIWKILNSET